jgi:hypothetical protein
MAFYDKDEVKNALDIEDIFDIGYKLVIDIRIFILLYETESIFESFSRFTDVCFYTLIILTGDKEG